MRARSVPPGTVQRALRRLLHDTKGGGFSITWCMTESGYSRGSVWYALRVLDREGLVRRFKGPDPVSARRVFLWKRT